MNDILDKYAVEMRIGREELYDGDKLVLETWKDIWEHIKKVLLDHRRKERKETYMGKKMQSEIYKGLEELRYQWMKCNIKPSESERYYKHARTDDRDKSMEA